MKRTYAFFLTLALVFFAVGTSGVVGATTVLYTYDAAGRLTGADYGGGLNIVYTYDANGNLLNRDLYTVHVSAGNCGGKTPCYHTLAEAVRNAPNYSLIKVAAESFSGYTVDAGKTLTFEWGYDSNFNTNTGVTRVQGTFRAKGKTIIRSGTIRAK
jgi:YD repeat-containing protein